MQNSNCGILTNRGGKKYTVITPVFNRADCIGRCINSVIKNLAWCGNIEHIIVDDGSTDETPTIIKQYAESYPHIKFIKFDNNKGTNAARNAAITSAQGDFSIILDSDDYFIDEAIKIIDNAVAGNAGYAHYLFTPSDRAEEFERHPLLSVKQHVFSFADFLNNAVTGDFIHVIKTDILKKYPFDEKLRIYEGPFFLRFYKEARHILYTNKIVTIRERSRTDSVTRDTFKTSKPVIEKAIKSKELWFDWFADDCVKLGLVDTLRANYISLLQDYLLLADYRKAKELIGALKELNGNMPFIIMLVYRFHLGILLRLAGKFYLKIKYDVFNTNLK